MDATPFANLAASDYITSGFAFGNNPNNFCCIARNFHPLGWTPSTSSTSSSTSTTTTVVPSTTTSTSSSTSTSTTTAQEPFIILNVLDLNFVMSAMGVTDATSASQWNEGFDSYWGGETGAAFTSVEVTGNIIKFFGGLDGLLYTPFYNLDIISFNTTSHLPSIRIINMFGNLLTEFNPSVQITSSSLTLLNLRSNNITTFNPTYPLPNSITEINLSINQLTSFNTTLPLPSSLQNLFLTSNFIEDFNTLSPLPASLRRLQLDTNLLTDFDPVFPFPNLFNLILTNNPSLSSINTNVLQSNLFFFFAGTCAFPSNIVNDILARCVVVDTQISNILLSGGTNGCPTGQGLIDKATLQASGVSVNTNVCATTTTTTTAPFISFAHNFTSESDSALQACSKVSSQTFYSTLGTLSLGDTMYQEPSLINVVLGGLSWYKSGAISYKINDFGGIIQITPCPVFQYNINTYNCSCNFVNTGNFYNLTTLTPGKWFYNSATGTKMQIDTFVDESTGFGQHLIDTNGFDTCAEVSCTNTAFGYFVHEYSCDCVFLGTNSIVNSEGLSLNKWYYDSATNHKFVIISFDGMAATPDHFFVEGDGKAACTEVIGCPTTTTTTTFLSSTAYLFANTTGAEGIDACNDHDFLTTLYSVDPVLVMDSVLYSDNERTTPVEGNDLWYHHSLINGAFKIDNSGVVIDILDCS